ncbi:hypothetical protein ABZW18_20290 [Streptomyces sp. NPDC004647]|uniref:hypothetical protein n=1 Tax=Streptomyces sp. NPDC004647 TaxID=3154671 RepID=UPI0033BCBA8A
MSREQEIDDSELMDVAHDSEQAHRLHKALRTLADNPSVDGPLKDMAKNVLSGRIGMRDALQTESYMDAMGARMTEIRRAAEAQTPEEREAQRGQVERWREAQREEEERERAERDGPTQLPGRRPRGGPSHRP